MCRNPVRLATAVAAIATLSAAASPASAGLSGGAKPATSAATATSSGPTTPSATPAESKSRKATPEERAAAGRLEPLARAAFWTREFDVDPTDAVAGVELSKALRAMGQYQPAVEAADKVLVLQPKNLDALLEDARDKIGANQGFYAIEILQRAKAAAPKDWRPLSLLGVALEQSERPQEAKEAYETALKLSPDNPAVLSNLGLYYAGRGDVVQAEAMMRRAAARPDATAQERQNLALILGLEGKLAEAEALLRKDLPPDQVRANLAYLQGVAAPSVAGAANAATTANLQAATSPRNWNALEGAQVQK